MYCIEVSSRTETVYPNTYEGSAYCCWLAVFTFLLAWTDESPKDGVFQLQHGGRYFRNGSGTFVYGL